MASRRRDDSFTEPYNEPVRRSGRDRHNLLYNSLDENIMQTPLFQHILDEANNSRHHGMYSTTTSPSRSQNASNNKQPSQPASSAIRRSSALLARERLHHYDHSNNRQQEDDDEEDPEFESNRYSFRSRQSSMKEYHRNSNSNSVGNSGKKNRSIGHRIYDEVGSFSPTPKSVHSEEDEEVPVDENKHGRSRKSLNKSINGKSISPKDMSISSVTDGRRLSSRVANQSMRTQLLRRSGGLALSKSMQPLGRLAIEGGGEEEDQDFGLTMYERVKSQPRQRQCRQNYQVNSVEYIEESETKPLINRHNNQQQDYQPQVKRSRYSRERTSNRVVIDDGEDENSRETIDSNDGPPNPPKNTVEAPNEEEEEDADAPRQYLFRQRRAPPTQQIVQYSTDRPVRNCRMNMSISAGAFGGRAVSENRIKFSSSRTAGKHSSRRSTSRHGGRHTHRRRHGSSGSSSTSSSSSDAESGNRPSGITSAKQDARQEARFERRKLKSLAKGRRNLMPMNLTEKEIASSSMSSREKLRKLGSSCADIDPMQIDNKVGFEQIGGLTKHIQSLKEVVVFPMLYPEYFQQFDVSPPKGVLFYGPPGTGKTLVARALANECSKDGQKVAFFMRKGADCLSKWVGESERQLRLLFDQAYAMRPSIIFFDEIDGLAPVRSSKQDQIHSSIVSTLLALMDGLDKRGEVIVIGATNRLDSIDPALRRPGRFDREMRFDLPDKTAREAILKIHTSAWKECQPDEQVLQWLADQSSGYCGADLRALCTEAVLVALRESFPYIYLSAEKLLIDPSKVKITRQHFLDSLRQIVPASRRDMSVVSHQLNERSGCLIEDFIESTMTTRIPKGYVQRTNCVENLYKTDLERVVMGLKTPPSVPAARLLLHGHGQLGQSTHYLPVLLNRLDHLPVFSLSSESIYSSGSPEENVSQAIRSALRATSQGTAVVVLLPDIDVLHLTLPPHLWKMLMSSLSAFTGLTPVLLLASLQQHYTSCPDDIKQLFRHQNAIEVKCPTELQRKTYYKKLLDKAMERPVEFNAALYPLPEKAPKDVPIRRVSATEYKELRNTYNQMLRQLRMFLRDILARLVRDRRFAAFQLPVDKDDAEDYYEIIEKPMCLTQMMSKIDAQEYEKVESFMEDIHLIKFNALEYNPDKNMEGKTMRHNAIALVDAAEELLCVEYENTFSDKLAEFKKLLAEAKAGDNNELENLPSTSSVQVLKQPAAKPSFVDPPTNAKKPQMGRRGKKKQGRASAIPLNTTMPNILPDNKRRRTAPASLLHLSKSSIVKKYNKLQKNSSLRSSQKSEDEDVDVKRQLSRKNSPPMLEESTQDSLPVPELVAEHCATTTSSVINNPFGHVESKTGQSGSERKEIKIDERLLKIVLIQCLEKTYNWSIPDVESLGAVLTQAIEEFADHWDRRTLPERLEQVLQCNEDQEEQDSSEYSTLDAADTYDRSDEEYIPSSDDEFL